MNYYFSSIDGSDSGAGTIVSPYRSMTKLNSVLGTATGGDVLFLKKGSIWTNEPPMQPTKSGSTGYPIVIDAYGNDGDPKPTISGFQTITNWAPSPSTGIYQTQIFPDSSPNVVIVNGVNTGPGRYPKFTPGRNPSDGGYLFFEQYTANASIWDKDLPASPNWTGAAISIRNQDWTIYCGKVTSHLSNGTLIYSGITATPQSANRGYFFTHDIRCCTSVGDWFYDGSLFYMYFGQNDPYSYEVKVAVQDSGVYTNYRNNMTFKNLDIEGMNYAGIWVAGGSNITLESCNIKKTNYYGINMH